MKINLRSKKAWIALLAGISVFAGVVYLNVWDYERHAAQPCTPFPIAPDWATLYERGNVLPQDFEQAAKLYRKSAETGNHLAQFKLGELYTEGKGVKRDYQEAYFWISVAASKEQKYADAISNAAKNLSPDEIAAVDERVQNWVKNFYNPRCELVVSGGVPFDYVLEELKETLAAAAQGSPTSQARLSHSFLGSADYKRAYFWSALALGNKVCDSECRGFAINALEKIDPHLTLEEKSAVDKQVKEWKPQQMALPGVSNRAMNDIHYQAAQSGVTSAQYELGNVYADVQGNHTNFEEAYFWYSLAANAEPGNKAYSTHRNAIKSNLTPREIEIIDWRVHTWKPTSASQPDSVQSDAINAFLSSQTAEEKESEESRQLQGSAAADLNGDGKAEVILVWMTVGPTYWHNNLTVFSQMGSGYKPVSTLALRGEAKLSAVKDGVIIIDHTENAAKDRRCCPTIKKQGRYEWRDGKLSEIQ